MGSGLSRPRLVGKRRASAFASIPSGSRIVQPSSLSCSRVTPPRAVSWLRPAEQRRNARPRHPSTKPCSRRVGCAACVIPFSPEQSCNSTWKPSFAMSSAVMATEKDSSAAKAFIPTQGLSASLLTEPLESAGNADHAAAPHHAKLASSTPSFLQRLVSPPKDGEDNEDYLANGCIVM